ncbi:MAG: NUDIX hydrolase [Acidaminococcaceae bacterium]|nr:NUDIX hydrolase [Acidaminococcaceae bacterium]
MKKIKKFSETSLDEKYIEGSRENIFSGKLLHVKKDYVRLPNGAEASREYIVHPGAVAVVAQLADGKVVLVKQCRYPLGTVMWEIPAGKLDGDEDLLTCAKRELSEETGYEAHTWKHLLSIATTPGFSDEIIHIYKAEDLEKHAQHTDSDEFVDVALFTPEEINNMLREGELYDAKSICALYAAEILQSMP